MFCDLCIATATNGFHKFECQAMDKILSSKLTATMQMALRTFFVALDLFDGSIEALKEFIEKADIRTVFDFKDSKESSDQKKKLLASNSLVFVESVKVNSQVFKDIFESSEVLKPFLVSHNEFIESFLVKQTRIGTMNYHGIYAWPLKKSGLVDDEVGEQQDQLAYKRGDMLMGHGSYPFIALINHSCTPNTSKIFIDDKAVLVVTKPIEKNEQIFDTYGFNFTLADKGHRQSELLKRYKFRCSCKACENDWPLLPYLKISDKATFNKAKKVCRDLSTSSLNQKKAIEKYREINEAIAKGQKTFPSLEICSLMQSSAAYLDMSLRPTIQFS